MVFPSFCDFKNSYLTSWLFQKQGIRIFLKFVITRAVGRSWVNLELNILLESSSNISHEEILILFQK